MVTYYGRKTLSSLDELNREQAKIRKRYTSIEHHFLESILQPEKIAVTIGSNLVRKFRSKKQHTPKSELRHSRPAAKTHPLSSLKGGGRLIFKNITRSWLRWQVFNIAFFFGRKTIKWIQQRHKANNK
jgi:hypothetical protein